MNKIDGWIKLYRKLLDDVVWIKSTNEQRVILITLLMLASHKEKEWEWQGNKFKVMPGQFITSIDSIVKSCNGTVTTQNVRSAIVRLEKLNFLTNKSTKTGRLISIVNWEKYQGQEDDANIDTNKEVTKTQQRGNKEVTPIKNDKNDKNVINNIYAFWNGRKIIQHQKLTDGMQKSIEKRLKEFEEEEIIQAINNYDLILKGDEYFWNYKWTLKEFLDRGIEKFLDLDVCMNNFKTKPKSEPKKSYKSSADELQEMIMRGEFRDD